MKQYADILGASPLLYRMILRYVRDMARGDLFAAFDRITPITATNPPILPWESVKYVIKTNGEEMEDIEFCVVPESQETTITMAWDDKQHLEKSKDAMLQIMRNAVDGS